MSALAAPAPAVEPEAAPEPVPAQRWTRSRVQERGSRHVVEPLRLAPLPPEPRYVVRPVRHVELNMEREPQSAELRRHLLSGVFRRLVEW